MESEPQDADGENTEPQPLAILLHQVLPVMLVLAILSAVAVFIWPTRYWYMPYVIGQRHTTVRVDRFTGKAESLGELGWTVMQPKPAVNTRGLSR